MEIQDLGILRNQLTDKFLQDYTPKDIKLPMAFKEKVNCIDNFPIEYQDYTCIITSRYREKDLKIYFPNQWFYVATYFCDYVDMLTEYKQRCYKWFNRNGERSKIDLDKLIQEMSQDASLAEKEFEGYAENDKEFLIRFLTDYSWWAGGKTIERNDFVYTPIMSMANLVFQSQSFVGTICIFLSKHLELRQLLLTTLNEQNQQFATPPKLQERYGNHLTALRTKPFLLLAGISGTGKSRIVKEFAFKSCPDIMALRKDPTSPGNYCLIEVKPNWHDSTELLGYESQIGGKHYKVTPFVKFLAKAMLYEENAPFFVCLDEMNLAPVEQYFAEFLSVLESRKKVNGNITSEPLIKADIFKTYGDELKKALFEFEEQKQECPAFMTSDEGVSYGKHEAVFDRLKEEGMRIPTNLVVIGTVNMDETTHQFSRKVIDRAMTIEMDIEDGELPFRAFFDDYEELGYADQPLSKKLFLPKHVQAAEAIELMDGYTGEFVREKTPVLLAELNTALKGTPFKIAYRVQNELTLYFATLIEENPKENIETAMAKALDDIMMMKVLPRIEGDEELLEKPLGELSDFCTKHGLTASARKVKDMTDRLNLNHFTSFWP